MSLFFELGNEQSDHSADELKNGLFQALRALGPRNRVLAVPPDMTRFHSGAGNLTSNAYEFYDQMLNAVLPAVGTHAAMTPGQIAKMFAGFRSKSN